MTTHSSKSMPLRRPEEEVEAGYVAHPPFLPKAGIPARRTLRLDHVCIWRFLYIKDSCKHAPPTGPFPEKRTPDAGRRHAGAWSQAGTFTNLFTKVSHFA